MYFSPQPLYMTMATCHDDSFLIFLLQKIDVFVETIYLHLITMRLIFKGNISHLFLESIEVVNDDTNEEVESEEGTAYNENNKINVCINVVFSFWLFIYARCIHCICHHFHPTFKSCLEKNIKIVDTKANKLVKKGSSINVYLIYPLALPFCHLNNAITLTT